MGQRLVLNLYKENHELIANIYYHWSGSVEGAIDEAGKIDKFFNKKEFHDWYESNQPSDFELKKKILDVLSNTEITFAEEELPYALNTGLISRDSVYVDKQRKHSEGFISFSEEDMDKNKNLSEYSFDYNIIENTVDPECSIVYEELFETTEPDRKEEIKKLFETDQHKLLCLPAISHFIESSTGAEYDDEIPEEALASVFGYQLSPSLNLDTTKAYSLSSKTFLLSECPISEFTTHVERFSKKDPFNKYMFTLHEEEEKLVLGVQELS